MSKENTQAYENEPANYKEVRTEIESLMMAIKDCKERYAKIYSLDIVQEQFQDQALTAVGTLIDAIHLLGNIHGFMLTDDILESVHNK